MNFFINSLILQNFFLSSFLILNKNKNFILNSKFKNTFNLIFIKKSSNFLNCIFKNNLGHILTFSNECNYNNQLNNPSFLIQNCIFQISISYSSGSAIYSNINSNLTIINSFFFKFKSKINGGAIYK